MKWRIDQTLTKRMKNSFRAALGTALLCLLTTLGSYAQSTALTSFLECQDQLAEYSSMLTSVDESTPEGSELKVQLLGKIEYLTALASRQYASLTAAEQMDVQSAVAAGSSPVGVPDPSAELMARMEQLGMTYTTPSVAAANGAAVTTPSSGPATTNGPEITVP